jgi:hypothetical protein
MDCKNCKTEISSKYCPECGQPTSLKRIDGHYIVHEIEHVLHFERGILFTIRELVINPGQSIQNYLTENRSRLVKPIIFIIITSLIYTIVVNLLHIEEQYITLEGGDSTTPNKIFNWMREHYGYANIIMGIFIAFWTKIFFRRYQFNYFEILILLCFVIGISMLIYSIFALLAGLTGLKISQLGGIVGLAYSSWAIGQFFGKGKIINYIKALFAYLLGMLTFLITAFLLGEIFDIIVKS